MAFVACTALCIARRLDCGSHAVAPPRSSAFWIRPCARNRTARGTPAKRGVLRHSAGMKRGFRWLAEAADFVVPCRAAATAKPKSLMKTASLATRGAAAARPMPASAPASARTNVRRKTARPVPSGSRNQKIEERIAAASDELASGITQSASAAEELRRAMEQIATGAEEAAAASQETLAAANSTAATLAQARDRAVDGARPDRCAAKAHCRQLERNQRMGEQHQDEWRAPGGVGRRHGKAQRTGRQHRRCHQGDQPCLRSDQPSGLERRHRGRAGRRSRPGLRGCCRRSPGARGDFGEKRARCAKPRRSDPGTR